MLLVNFTIPLYNLFHLRNSIHSTFPYTTRAFKKLVENLFRIVPIAC